MRQRRGRGRFTSLLWGTCLLALVAAPAAILAEDEAPQEPAAQQPASQKQTDDSEQRETSLHGLRIYLDPETGRLTSRPSPEQIEALSRAMRASPSLKTFLSRSTEGLEPFELSVGGRGVALRGRFQNATVVRVQPDGTYRFHCVTDDEELHRHEPPQPEVESAER